MLFDSGFDNVNFTFTELNMVGYFINHIQTSNTERNILSLEGKIVLLYQQ